MDMFIILLATIFFAGIGLVGFFAPNRVIRLFGSTPHADMRNEIRTVYGGMCFAFALAGIASMAGIVPITWVASMFALVLLSNALGRSIGLVLERSSKIVWLFLAIETLLGSGALFVTMHIL
jgi:hypothetical protein